MFVTASKQQGDKADQAVSVEKKSKTTALQRFAMKTIIFAKIPKLLKLLLCQFHHEIRASKDCLEIFAYYSSPELFLVLHICAVPLVI